MKQEIPLLVKGGRIVDPAQKIDFAGDLMVENGKVSWMIQEGQQSPDLPSNYQLLDAEGLIVCPGFIDLHCHLREPGFEAKETIATGTAAAAAGGFTTVCAMPNTYPVLDNASLIDFVYQRSRQEGVVRVLPIGAITEGSNGKNLSEMYEMANAGAIGFSDDGKPVSDPNIMRQALIYSKGVGLPIIEHAEEIGLSSGGSMHDGWVSARLGLTGIPAAAEESAILRDISLVRETGGQLHVAHISTTGSLEAIRHAKNDGLAVTAEVTPHHLALTHEWILGRRDFGSVGEAYDTLAKVNPPLRTSDDCEALIAGLQQGIIDVIATDHAPHTPEDKLVEFGDAAVGFTGLETAVGLLLTLVRQKRLDLVTVIRCLTEKPASLLAGKVSGVGRLSPGSCGDITLLNLAPNWIVDSSNFKSKGKNTPLDGATLTGRVVATVYEGHVVHDSENRFLPSAKGALDD
jgi:dihydroorotase